MLPNPSSNLENLSLGNKVTFTNGLEVVVDSSSSRHDLILDISNNGVQLPHLGDLLYIGYVAEDGTEHSMKMNSSDVTHLLSPSQCITPAGSFTTIINLPSEAAVFYFDSVLSQQRATWTLPS